MNTAQKPTVIIGAGPAGLTAAYELTQRGVPCVIIEKDNIVGGISRTEEYKGYRFDIGGHRFFSKSKRVMDFWHSILDEDFLVRPRLSHIYYKNKFFSYPIKAFDALRKLGIWNSFLCMASYTKAKFFPRKEVKSFEDYIINNFGEKLYLTFFKSYTEKVWGMPCTEISADWAAQRIKGLSLTSTIKAAIFGDGKEKITTLIEEFYYPRLGPGMMWEAVLEKCIQTGLCEIRLNTEIKKVHHSNNLITSVTTINKQAVEETLNCTHLFSSMPIGHLLCALEPQLYQNKIDAAKSLSYRDFILVALITNRTDLFPDNWIYIHDPHVKVGRIQNFGNWSEDLVPNKNTSCLGMEYFVFKDDDMWNKQDSDLIEQAKQEIEKIGLAKSVDVIDGKVIRVEKTYPIYDEQYEKLMPIVKEAIDEFKNLYPIGRNGMHRYNNQDHSMLTSMLSVENMFGEKHDIWSINAEQEYHEEKAG